MLFGPMNVMRAALASQEPVLVFEAGADATTALALAVRLECLDAPELSCAAADGSRP